MQVIWMRGEWEWARRSHTTWIEVLLCFHIYKSAFVCALVWAVFPVSLRSPRNELWSAISLWAFKWSQPFTHLYHTLLRESSAHTRSRVMCTMHVCISPIAGSVSIRSCSKFCIFDVSLVGNHYGIQIRLHPEMIDYVPVNFNFIQENMWLTHCISWIHFSIRVFEWFNWISWHETAFKFQWVLQFYRSECRLFKGFTTT